MKASDTQASASNLAKAVFHEAAKELSKAASVIDHCLKQLSDEQVWWRPAEDQNSIGNLLLHLCGNVRQWLICGLAEKPDRRNRPAEFAERGPIGIDRLLAMLHKTVEEAVETLNSTAPEQLLEKRRIQGFDGTVLSAIFSSVPHFRGHTQEIVYRTRSCLGSSYHFAWTPTAAQGGRAGVKTNHSRKPAAGRQVSQSRGSAKGKQDRVMK